MAKKNKKKKGKSPVRDAMMMNMGGPPMMGVAEMRAKMVKGKKKKGGNKDFRGMKNGVKV